MEYVIGIDLGTSAVKVILVNLQGEICIEVSQPYPLLQIKSGFIEQNPEDWVSSTIEALKDLVGQYEGEISCIKGISFSGQMHGLVLLDKQYKVLRPAILWNDTRNTKQCQYINESVGQERLLKTSKNLALEGFTLPKLLWVKEMEPAIYERVEVFLLPKDYLRFRLTGKIHSDFSDAAGTLMLEVDNRQWNKEIFKLLDLDVSICPPLVDSHFCVGTLKKEIAKEVGLYEETKIFAGGADNACGAVGSGIVEDGDTLCSIGTSGVILSYEENANHAYGGKLHIFNHAKANSYYAMGVTLSAGHSLNWFKENFGGEESYEELLASLRKVPIGANGLLFTPYLVGERCPYADSYVRGSFIGIDNSHNRYDFLRAVIEGITFSLNESIEIFRSNGKTIHSIVSIGGGAKSDIWLQMQADIFNSKIIKLSTEQGPALGAAIIAAFGCGWFSSLKECFKQFNQPIKSYYPIPENVERYKVLYELYKQIYPNTKVLTAKLAQFRN